MSVEWLLVALLFAGAGFLVFQRPSDSRFHLLGALFVVADLLAVWSRQTYLRSESDQTFEWTRQNLVAWYRIPSEELLLEKAGRLNQGAVESLRQARNNRVLDLQE